MKCILIEDEKPAQRVLMQYIEKCPGLELIGCYRTAMEAQAVLNGNQVDLLFLDINLPVVSGIALLKTMSNPPLVIITTAYSNYALDGFELNVVDYLLKPFAFDRFLKATNKAFKLLEPKMVVNNAFHSLAIEEDSIVINMDKTLHKLLVKDIKYVASDKDYVCFFTDHRKFVFIGSLKNWQVKLKNKGFVRVHKSFLVNLKRITKVVGNTIKLEDVEIPIGRSYRNDFLAAFIS
jgi:DNA-binding LytR/AlgR family response regulator